MKKIILSISLTMTFLFSNEITIAVAANVSYAINPLIKAFNIHKPDIKVNVVMGSSGKLTAQIRHGAPYDIFLSANMIYPNTLYANALAVTKPVIYAQGSLAILSPHRRDFSAGISILKDESIKKIAIANPKTAPYGVAAVEVLKNIKLYNKLKKKFVYGESISQTVLYATRVADIGIIAKSSLYSPQMSEYKKATHWVEINSKSHTPISQGMVILKQAENNQEVKLFYDFILGLKAKEILESFGYNVL